MMYTYIVDGTKIKIQKLKIVKVDDLIKDT